MIVDNLVAQIFPQFEKMCLTEYDQGRGQLKEVFHNASPKLTEKIARLREPGWKNELEGVLEMLRSEIREVEGMNDALNTKTLFEELRQKAIAKQKTDNEEMNKIKMGKSTFKSLFTTKKTDEVVADIQKVIDNVTINCLGVLTHVDDQRY